MRLDDMITSRTQKTEPLAKISARRAVQIFTDFIEELKEKPGHVRVSPNSPFVKELREKFLLLRRIGDADTESALIDIIVDDPIWPESVDPDWGYALSVSLAQKPNPTLEDAIWYIFDDQSVSEGFFVKDLDLRYMYVNPAMERYLGRDFNSIVGRRDSDFHTDAEVERLIAGYQKALEGELVRLRNSRTCNGVQRLFFESYVAKRSRSGERTGIYGIIRDITDQEAVIRPDATSSLDVKSPKMQQTMIECLRVADSDSIVLLLGESGSGKDHLARYIHDHSKRAGEPFEVLNSSAFPATMIEAELFGYECGAFTGAHTTKKGLLEIAENGTLLLTEIGELPLDLQAKLLTFLDLLTFRRLGGSEKIEMKARLIVATNRDLAKEVEAGTFRRDLFYRLNVFQIRVPPLRERIVEIPNLVRELLEGLAKRMGLDRKPEISPRDISKLCQYDWPGNVRQLRNALERAIVLSRGPTIAVDDVDFKSEERRGPESVASIGPALRPVTHLTDEEFRTMYKEACVKTLDNGIGGGFKGSATAIATALGYQRETVSRKLKRLGCPPVEKGRSSKAALDNLIERIESWLTRHGFEHDQTPR